MLEADTEDHVQIWIHAIQKEYEHIQVHFYGNIANLLQLWQEYHELLGAYLKAHRDGSQSLMASATARPWQLGSMIHAVGADRFRSLYLPFPVTGFSWRTQYQAKLQMFRESFMENVHKLCF